MDIVGSTTLRDQWDYLVAHRGDRSFLVFEDGEGVTRRYTYAQFARQITRSANLFTSLGVARGDAVALHMHNCPELLMSLFALSWLGAVAVPLHPRNTVAECTDVVQRVRARIVVTEDDLSAMYGPGGIDVEHIVVARGVEPLAGTIHFDGALAEQGEHLDARVELSSDDPVSIVFTSGTTARPKGVVLTHANLLFSGIFVNWQAAMSPEDRLLTTMPACHVNFQLNALMPVLTVGATLVAIERYSASRFWRQACEYDATIVQSIAMMVRTMLMQPVAEGERSSSVREVLYYLPISDEEKALFEERFATRILNSYGTSETLVGVITDPPHGERRWPSIGRVGLGYEARVMVEGRDADPEEIGEIQVRGIPGRTLMLGYHEDPEATAAVYDADGWLRTGDLGYVDADGWFYFMDRRTHMIKRAGENVSPVEVEAVLTDDPRVAEAAVIGVPDPVHDEAVKAFVVPVPGVALTVEDVQALCAASLAAFKVPTVVEIVGSLPKTRSFKVAKSSLK